MAYTLETESSIVLLMEAERVPSSLGLPRVPNIGQRYFLSTSRLRRR